MRYIPEVLSLNVFFFWFYLDIKSQTLIDGIWGRMESSFKRTRLMDIQTETSKAGLVLGHSFESGKQHLVLNLL